MPEFGTLCDGRKVDVFDLLCPQHHRECEREEYRAVAEGNHRFPLFSTLILLHAMRLLPWSKRAIVPISLIASSENRNKSVL